LESKRHLDRYPHLKGSNFGRESKDVRGMALGWNLISAVQGTIAQNVKKWSGTRPNLDSRLVSVKSFLTVSVRGGPPAEVIARQAFFILISAVPFTGLHR